MPPPEAPPFMGTALRPARLSPSKGHAENRATPSPDIMLLPADILNNTRAIFLVRFGSVGESEVSSLVTVVVKGVGYKVPDSGRKA